METNDFLKSNIRFEAPAKALERWDPTICAADPGETNINIYSTIGEYGDGSGMTPKIVSGILRKAAGADVNVNINSPGGDFFDGLAIHTLLAEYEGSVNVRIVGLAASAASVVAMAGDNVKMAEGAFIMVHNSWTVAFGNKSDMQKCAAMLTKFDASMASVYAKKTGMQKDAVCQLMDAETWLSAEDACKQGFADSQLATGDVGIDPAAAPPSALRRLDVALAKAGMPRSERRALIKELTGTPCAAVDVKPSADSKLIEALQGLQNIIKS
jgi:ATP-dependent Clp protease protease subunit